MLWQADPTFYVSPYVSPGLAMQSPALNNFRLQLD
jgi:hypothetical protein